jgi:SM-20-related protein
MLTVRDDAISQQAHDHLCYRLDRSGWIFGHSSVPGQERPFWKMVLDGDAATDQLWTELKPWCEGLVGGPLVVLRQYANGHTFGQGGKAHTDDHREGSFTLLVYPMAEWRPEWEGDTVYFAPDGSIAQRVSPKPRRAVLFDARVPHAGLAPSQSFTGLRRSVAFKLLRKPIFDAQPLPQFTLDRYTCEPFDGPAREASIAALKASLLEQLASSYTEPLKLEHLALEKKRLAASGLTLGPVETQALAEHRLKSGFALLKYAAALGFEAGAPTTEARTIQALLQRASITERKIERDALLAL